MGVQGLHAYVEQQGLLKDARFPDPSQDAATLGEQEQVAAVLDGNALVHRLYFDALDWILGGQYSAFALVLQRYLAQLAAANVRVAKVIFDGGRGSPAKQAERLARDTRKTSQAYHAVQPLVHNASVSLHKGSVVHDDNDDDFMPARKSRRHRTRRSFGTAPVIPLLAIPHAIRVLREMGVPVAVAQDEADRVVAAEANALNAYAVSRDSDYYIFPLVKGYIPMDSISFGEGTMSCKVYQVESLAHASKVPVSLLPILATAMGNDY
ncbi:Protein asteroid 1, partial [Allomyces javanicus]